MNGATHSLVIGLTGGIGSGKSTIAELFAKLGVPIVDADAISHELTQAHGKAMPLIEQAFGAKLIDAQGALDRKAMRELAFTDNTAKQKLESILHPLIRDEIDAQLDVPLANAVACKLLVVPLLVESGHYAQRCHRVLVVDCEEEVQIQRVTQRSNISRDEVLAIIRKQATREQRLAAADDVINNSHVTLEQLNQEVKSLHTKYLEAMSCLRTTQ